MAIVFPLPRPLSINDLRQSICPAPSVHDDPELLLQAFVVIESLVGEQSPPGDTHPKFIATYLRRVICRWINVVAHDRAYHLEALNRPTNL